MITLNQIKNFLNISSDETSKDDLLKSFISNATGEINSLCSRRFDYSTHTEISSGTGGITLVLDNYPVSEVETVEILAGDEWENLFKGTDKFSTCAILLKEVGIIKLLKSYTFPKGERNVRILYSAGYKFADEWKPEVIYSIDDRVKFNKLIYKCIEEHTSGNEFDVTKWELDPAKPVPEALAKAVMYLAAKQFYESPAGKILFMKSSESYGNNQSNYKDIDISQIVHTHRNTNV